MRIPKCPHCGKSIAGLEMTPSQAKIKLASVEADIRRRRRDCESDVRQWYKPDFQLVYDAVSHTKLDQAKPGKNVSSILFQAILKCHQTKLDELEAEVEEKVEERLTKYKR